MEEIVEMHAIARGNVQGVGFRATTQRIGSEMKLKGSVKNMPEGTVEIYAQGTKTQIENFCKVMNSHWQGYMEPLAPTLLKGLNRYDGFEVRF
ncbi:MAG: acylphosphatase [Parachlamydia sp.]|nr:acylphosphatase [Parachlamydia sp.]